MYVGEINTWLPLEVRYLELILIHTSLPCQIRHSFYSIYSQTRLWWTARDWQPLFVTTGLICVLNWSDWFELFYIFCKLAVTFHSAIECNTAVYFERWYTGQFKWYSWQTVNHLAFFSFKNRPRFTPSNRDRTRLYETSIIIIILNGLTFNFKDCKATLI